MQIIAIAATSLDGFITQGDKPGTAFTSKADKAWFPNAVSTFDFKIMGRKTFEVSKDYILPLTQNQAKDKRIVMTRYPEQSKAFEVPGRLEFTDKHPLEIVRDIQDSSIDTPKIVILGGSTIYSAFLDAGLITEFWITLEPLLFGFGTPLLKTKTQTKLSLIESTSLSPSTLLLKYRCEY